MIPLPPFTCEVVKVHDGDGPLWCRSGQRIRIAGIQAPRSGGTGTGVNIAWGSAGREGSQYPSPAVPLYKRCSIYSRPSAVGTFANRSIRGAQASNRDDDVRRLDVFLAHTFASYAG